MFKLWLDDFELSKWAYLYCRDVYDDLRIRIYVTHPHWAYRYCKYVNDISEVRNKICSPYHAYLYCTTVRHDIQWLIDLYKSESLGEMRGSFEINRS